MAQDDFSIALGHTAADWKALKLEPATPDTEAWRTAIAMLRERISGRFFAPVDLLIKEQEPCKQTYGFVVLAIDCLVIETLQGFRQGKKNHKKKSQELFTSFLLGWPVFRQTVPEKLKPEDAADRVYFDCRCALLHSGSTDGFIVGTRGEAFAFGENGLLKINRTKLHEELKLAFDAYLLDLLKPELVDLRKNFLTKMNAICGVE